MDHKSVRKLLPKTDTAAKEAVQAAAKLIEERRKILLEIAGGNLSNTETLLQVADAIEVAAASSIWEAELNK